MNHPNQNIDFHKMLELKLQGKTSYDAIRLAGGTVPTAERTGFGNKRIRAVLDLASDYWRYNILKGAKRVASPKKMGKRLAETAMGYDDFNSTQAVKALSAIIMRNKDTISTGNSINIGKVYIIPPQSVSADDWRQKVSDAQEPKALSNKDFIEIEGETSK